MGLLQKVIERANAPTLETRSISTMDDYVSMMQSFMFNGVWFSGGVQQTLNGLPVESVPYDITSYATQIYERSGPVFALMAIRMMCFSAIRFQWQQISNGRPNRIAGNGIVNW